MAGVTATTTSIGGPPVALLYQHRSATQIRSTLGVFFAVGALISLIGIGLGGGLDTRAIGLGIALSPARCLRRLGTGAPRPQHHVNPTSGTLVR